MGERPWSPSDGGKPGQTATPCGPGASRRPCRPRSPVALPVRNELTDLVARPVLPPPRAKRPRRGRGPSRCGAATLGPAPCHQPETCVRGRTRISPATSRVRLGAASRKSASGQAIAVIVPAVGLARGEERHSARRAGSSASLIERNQPTGVRTRCGLCCSAGLRQRLDDRRVPVRLVQLERKGSARIAPTCHRRVVLQAWPRKLCPLRRCLFVVGLITIFKEGVCSSRYWSMRSHVPMRR